MARQSASKGRAVAIGYKNWRSPTQEGSIFRELDAKYGFTLDAAASHANALCQTYYTLDGCYTKDSERGPQKLSDQDGLHGSWGSHRVWDNPPYDSGIKDWIEKAHEEQNPVTAFLLPPSVDTEWYDLLWPKGSVGLCNVTNGPNFNGVVFLCAGGQQREIRFYKGRARFLRPKREIQVMVDNDLIWVPDETDEESVEGAQPRAGNLVYIVRNARGPR